MDKLDHGGEQGVVFPLVPAGLRRENHQHRAQSLAAAQDNMLAELIDQHHFRGKIVGNDLVHPQHIAAGELFEIIQRERLTRGDGGFRHSAEYRKDTARDLALTGIFVTAIGNNLSVFRLPRGVKTLSAARFLH